MVTVCFLGDIYLTFIKGMEGITPLFLCMVVLGCLFLSEREIGLVSESRLVSWIFHNVNHALLSYINEHSNISQITLQ